MFLLLVLMSGSILKVEKLRIKVLMLSLFKEGRSSEHEADNTGFVGLGESVQGSEEIELFGYCYSEMGKHLKLIKLFVDEIDKQRSRFKMGK